MHPLSVAPDQPPCSTKIMDPEVPQALRLQAILVGGVVVVFTRQSGILLEDAQEMVVSRGREAFNRLVGAA